MKKIIIILMLLIVGMTASAQEGEWRKQRAEGDELKGTSTSDVYSFINPEMGAFSFSGFDTYTIFLIAEKAQFNVETIYTPAMGYYSIIKVLVGFYDGDGKMKDKFEMTFDLVKNSSNRMIYASSKNRVGYKSKIKKIYKALQEQDGYVRMVTSRFQNTDFDLKILPIKDLQ